MGGPQIPVRTSRIVEAEVDGQRMLMSPDGRAYIGLLGTGNSVWDLIDGTRTVDDMVVQLAAEFDADPTQIRTDVLTFLSDLRAAGLLVAHA